MVKKVKQTTVEEFERPEAEPEEEEWDALEYIKARGPHKIAIFRKDPATGIKFKINNFMTSIVTDELMNNIRNRYGPAEYILQGIDPHGRYIKGTYTSIPMEAPLEEFASEFDTGFTGGSTGNSSGGNPNIFLQNQGVNILAQAFAEANKSNIEMMKEVLMQNKPPDTSIIIAENMKAMSVMFQGMFTNYMSIQGEMEKAKIKQYSPEGMLDMIENVMAIADRLRPESTVDVPIERQLLNEAIKLFTRREGSPLSIPPLSTGAKGYVGESIPIPSTPTFPTPVKSEPIQQNKPVAELPQQPTFEMLFPHIVAKYLMRAEREAEIELSAASLIEDLDDLVHGKVIDQAKLTEIHNFLLTDTFKEWAMKLYPTIQNHQVWFNEFCKSIKEELSGDNALDTSNKDS